jgi:hypothetical protein
VQLKILHETLFTLAEQKGSLFQVVDEKSLSYDMLLLMTFGQMRKRLFSLEYSKKLGMTLETILKPRVIERCAGLQVVVRRILGYISKECLEYSMNELTRIFANILRISTRIDGQNNVQKDIATANACSFVSKITEIIQLWQDLK